MKIKSTHLILIAAMAMQSAVAIASEAEGEAKKPAPPAGPAISTLSSYLPHWLDIGAQLRGRLEGQTGIGYVPGVNDMDFLSRVRLDMTIKPLPWFKVYLQGQDARAFGYNNRTASVQDPLEFRVGYVEVGSQETTGVVARVGRQELNYGGARLMAAGDWSNSSRSFDAGVVSLYRWNMKLDLLTASVLLTDMNRPDRHKAGERISGGCLTIAHLVPQGSIEPYLFYRTQLGVSGEKGDLGRSDIAVGGVRAVGKIPGRFDYDALVTREWGTYASDRMLAFGGTYMGGWTVTRSAMKPRISAEYTHASGDSGTKDGKRGTFDQMYGTSHFALGTADRLGWRNSRNTRVGFDFSPFKKVKVVTDFRNLALSTVKDGLYAGNGTRAFLNAKATSTHVGEELDSYMLYRINRSTSIGGGMGHIFPGAYLRQTTKGSGYTYPYLMFTRTL